MFKNIYRYDTCSNRADEAIHIQKLVFMLKQCSNTAVDAIHVQTCQDSVEIRFQGSPGLCPMRSEDGPPKTTEE